MNEKPKPTELELDILGLLWREGPLTVRQVHDGLLGRRPVVYTTILKAMQVMHEKGLLDRDDSARSHVYRPTMKKEEVTEGFFNNVVDRFFEGSAAALAMHALSRKSASNEEIRKIHDLLDKLEDKKPDTQE